MKRFILLVLMFLPIVVLGQEKSNFHSLDTNVISEVEISTYRLQGYRKNLHNTRYSQKDSYLFEEHGNMYTHGWILLHFSTVFADSVTLIIRPKC